MGVTAIPCSGGVEAVGLVEDVLESVGNPVAISSLVLEEVAFELFVEVLMLATPLVESGSIPSSCHLHSHPQPSPKPASSVTTLGHFLTHLKYFRFESQVTFACSMFRSNTHLRWQLKAVHGILSCNRIYISSASVVQLVSVVSVRVKLLDFEIP